MSTDDPREIRYRNFLKGLAVGRRYQIDDPQQPFVATYQGEVNAMWFAYRDWYSKDFSDPYLRIRPEATHTLRKFRPIGREERDPPYFFEGELWHVPSGLGGVFTVEFIGLRPAHHFIADGGMNMVLSEERAQKIAGNPLPEENPNG